MGTLLDVSLNETYIKIITIMDTKGLSSLTKKFIMSFMGLFLIIFLFVHLGINFLLLINKEWFNIAAHFMASNWIVKVFEVGLFAGFIVHIIYAIILYFQNNAARPINYKVKFSSEKSYFSKYMIHTAVIIFIFLVWHLVIFYFKSKFGDMHDYHIAGKDYHDMAQLVIDAFQSIGFVLFNVFIFIILGFHLHHGFQSALQSLGINHPKYNKCIDRTSSLIAIVLTIGFVSIPLIIYFGNIN